eukprot:4925-Amphidinium_carterae.3
MLVCASGPPVAATVHRGGRESKQSGARDRGEIKILQMVRHPVHNALTTGQDLSFSFAKEHALGYQPAAYS